MSRLAALLVGVATAQTMQNYYGNANPHVRRELAPRLRAAGADGACVLLVVRAPGPLQRRHRRGAGRRRPPVSGLVSFL